MNALTQINTAMMARGMVPLTFTCEVCKETWDREDHMTGCNFPQADIDRVKMEVGDLVCGQCAEDHLAKSEDHFCDFGCRCEDCVHKRQERFGWEQV